MESLERHEELVRGCSLCFAGGGNTPVVDVPKEVRVLLVAQAPGGTGGKAVIRLVQGGGSLAG